MELRDILHLIGVIALLGYGLGSLLLPKVVAPLIAHHFDTPRGWAEFRIVNGGYFIGLSIFALLVNTPVVYQALGVGWLGAAGARVFALFVDRPKLEIVYVGLLIAEIILGIFLMI